MQRISNIQPAVTATGTYCAIKADTPVNVLPGVIVYHNSLLAATTINIVASAGTTAGTVQPLILCSDGVSRAYGPALSTTSAGALSLIQIGTPIYGASVQITGTITGGTVMIEITAVVV